MKKYFLFAIALCSIISCKKKEELTLTQSVPVSDIIVDHACALSLGYSSDTVYRLFIPNAFVPNGDVQDDTFSPVGTGDWQSYYFEIRNKYNEVIFKTSDPKRSWDGRVAGGDERVPHGLYQYYVEIKTGCPDAVHKYKGAVLIYG